MPVTSGVHSISAELLGPQRPVPSGRRTVVYVFHDPAVSVIMMRTGSPDVPSKVKQSCSVTNPMLPDSGTALNAIAGQPLGTVSF